MKLKINLLIAFLLSFSTISYAQYTFYNCNNDTIVLGEFSSHNNFQISIYGSDTMLRQYDTLYFERGKKANLFITDSFQYDIVGDFMDYYSTGNIEITSAQSYSFTVHVNSNKTIYYYITAYNFGGERSTIRAKYKNNGDIALKMTPEYESYLWSTGDTNSSIIISDDSLMVSLVTENICGHTFNDSIYIEPNNTDKNFIIGNLNNSKTIIKQYPIQIKSVYMSNNEIPIDLNNDNIDDINFFIQEHHSGQGDIYNLLYIIEPLSNTKIASIGKYIIQLDSMEIVSNQFNWNIGDNYLMYYSSANPSWTNFTKDSIKYICFKITENNKDKLYWMKLRCYDEIIYGWPNSPSGRYFEILEIAVQYNPSTSLNNNTASGVNIYPNPTSDLLIIDLKTKEETSVKIFNTNGSLVFSKKVNSDKIIVNTEEFGNGIYFITIENSKIKLTEKISKIGFE